MLVGGQVEKVVITEDDVYTAKDIHDKLFGWN